jgi:predicted extracellular nuclease
MDSAALLEWTNPEYPNLMKVEVAWSEPPGTIDVSPPNHSANIGGLTNGTKYTFTVTAVSFGGSRSAGVKTDVTPSGSNVLISQVYGGGGNTGAIYTNDFIELHNPGDAPADLAGWSVQYAGDMGQLFGTGKTDLYGTIPPGGYYLIQEGSSGTTGSPLPAPDATGNIGMGRNAGKVALVKSTELLPASNCPLDNPNVVDFIGYGTTTDCFYVAPAGDLSATTAALRKNSGCTDTKNNGADFEVLAPVPRNSADAPFMCNP